MSHRDTGFSSIGSARNHVFCSPPALEGSTESHFYDGWLMRQRRRRLVRRKGSNDHTASEQSSEQRNVRDRETAIVFGAGGGFGGAIAQGLAERGVNLGLVEADGDLLGKTESNCQMAGAETVSIVGDISNSAFVRAAVTQVADELGDTTMAVHAVGIYPRTDVISISNNEWERVLGVNLTSVFYLLRAVGPKMIESGNGRIVVFTSGLGTTGSARGSHYAVTKAGIDALVKSFAAESAKSGVRINALAPGLTNTRMMRSSNSEDYIKASVARSPSGQLGEPTDVVPLALFLLDEISSPITGQVYRLR